MEVSDQTLTEILRLTHENNRMLHKMRRNAWIHGILKFVLYALILVAAPLWIYSTYLAPLMSNMLQTMQNIQNTSTQAQNQFISFQNGWKELESKLPSFMQPK